MSALLAVVEQELDMRGDRPRHLFDFYPDEGPLRAELYEKHMSFFAAGAKFRQRVFLAANRVGKTEGVGLYELTCHLTGLYPDWWTGKVFKRGVRAWAAGDTGKTVREIIQYKLLGPPTAMGSGILPAHLIVDTKRGSGVADSIEVLYVKHTSGSSSQLLLKSYDQRREGFQGTEQDVILLDEEPPLAVYTECLLRTMTNNGIVMSTFTPLAGLSETVTHLFPGGRVDMPLAGVFAVQATWDDVPHLSKEVKEELWASIPPYQRDARSKGIPQLGAGAIYPVPESEIIVRPFEIPKHFPRAYGFDVGWNRTAAIWGAENRDTEEMFLYSEHYRGHAEPSVHAHAVMSRGKWVPGAIDPAARGRSQKDGEQLLSDYIDLGLELTPANNAREAGIYAVWQRLSAGKLKVFSSCQNWLSEYRVYRRDEKGRVVKDNDHLMDCTRYLESTGREIMIPEPVKKKAKILEHPGQREHAGWMQ